MVQGDALLEPVVGPDVAVNLCHTICVIPGVYVMVRLPQHRSGSVWGCSILSVCATEEPVPRADDAGPLPLAALVVPGHRTPSGRLALGVPGRHPR